MAAGVMAPPQVVVDLDEILTVVTFVSALVFVLVYSAVSPWWRSPLGRTLVMLDAALAVTLMPGVVHIVFGIQWGTTATAYLTLASFCLVPTAILWRISILLRTQAHKMTAQEPKTARERRV